MIVIDSDDEMEDDAAMARRLAAEWNNEDITTDFKRGRHTGSGSMAITGVIDVWMWMKKEHTRLRRRIPSFMLTMSASQMKAPIKFPVIQNPRMKFFRTGDLFTASRKCTKCKKIVKSPRGHVCEVLTNIFAADRSYTGRVQRR